MFELIGWIEEALSRFEIWSTYDAQLDLFKEKKKKLLLDFSRTTSPIPPKTKLKDLLSYRL